MFVTQTWAPNATIEVDRDSRARREIVCWETSKNLLCSLLLCASVG